MNEFVLFVGLGYLSSGVVSEPLQKQDADRYKGENIVVYSTAIDSAFPAAKATPA